MAIATAGASSYSQHPSAIRPVVRRRTRAPGSDGARRPCFADGCARRVRHCHRSRLLTPVVAAVVHDAGDGIRTVARAEGHREREDAAAVVRAARSRTRRSASRLPISTREAHTTVHRILTNPVYAGAYAFGRTGSRTHLENGRKRVVRGFRRARDECECCFVISRSAVRVRSPAPDFLLSSQRLTGAHQPRPPWRLLA